MDCPVCGGKDCVGQAKDIIEVLPTIFLPCPDCRARILDKRLPLPAPEYAEPCSCGKRYIDEVFAHMYVIMVEEGCLLPTNPLIDVGSPLIHPGCAVDRPPYLPEKSLVLLSSRAGKKTAQRLLREVPELRGVVRNGDFLPGIPDHDPGTPPRVYELVAGCDVRADIFPVRTGPLVMYKQQSRIHIEFPRFGYPKLRSVERHVGMPPVPFFVDACSGVGTLGLAAACAGVHHVIMNDAWYAAAFWSAINLEVNKASFAVDRVRICKNLRDPGEHPTGHEPVKIADTEGEQVIEVYHGDLRELKRVIPQGSNPVTVIDVFDKRDRGAVEKMSADWLSRVGGVAFVP